MKIIPAIDIIEGQCVRLSQGDFSAKTVYNSNPVNVARKFEDAGIKYLHVVDLDGAKNGSPVNLEVLNRICEQTGLLVDFGGGLKTTEDVRRAFDAGAHQITAGSIATKNRELVEFWLQEFGADKIILGADCKDRQIAVNGWQETTNLDVLEFIQSYEKCGATHAIVTDVAKDGMLAGPSLELYSDILSKTGIQLIASGGVSCMEDLWKLKALNCEGVIVGKAYYEGRISLKELSELC